MKNTLVILSIILAVFAYVNRTLWAPQYYKCEVDGKLPDTGYTWSETTELIVDRGPLNDFVTVTGHTFYISNETDVMIRAYKDTWNTDGNMMWFNKITGELYYSRYFEQYDGYRIAEGYCTRVEA